MPSADALLPYEEVRGRLGVRIVSLLPSATEIVYALGTTRPDVVVPGAGLPLRPDVVFART